MAPGRAARRAPRRAAPDTRLHGGADAGRHGALGMRHIATSSKIACWQKRRARRHRRHRRSRHKTGRKWASGPARVGVSRDAPRERARREAPARQRQHAGGCGQGSGDRQTEQTAWLVLGAHTAPGGPARSTRRLPQGRGPIDGFRKECGNGIRRAAAPGRLGIHRLLLMTGPRGR